MSKRADSIHPNRKRKDVSWNHDEYKSRHNNWIRWEEMIEHRALRKQVKEHLRGYDIHDIFDPDLFEDVREYITPGDWEPINSLDEPEIYSDWEEYLYERFLGGE